MRHGIWFAPGVRIPHRYGEGLIWDVFFRGGFATVWSDDASAGDYSHINNPEANFDTLFDVALVGGLDLLIRKGKFGVRASGKGFFYKTYPAIAWQKDWAATELFVMSPQVSLEGVYQF